MDNDPKPSATTTMLDVGGSMWFIFYDTMFTMVLLCVYFSIMYTVPLFLMYLVSVPVDTEQVSNEVKFAKHMVLHSQMYVNSKNLLDLQDKKGAAEGAKSLADFYRSYISTMKYEKDHMQCIDQTAQIAGWWKSMEGSDNGSHRRKKKKKPVLGNVDVGNLDMANLLKKSADEVKSACGPATEVSNSCNHLGTILDMPPLIPGLEMFTVDGGGGKVEEEEEEEEVLFKTMKDKLTAYLYSQRFLKTKAHGRKVLSSIFI